jgi:hypothetical protein
MVYFEGEEGCDRSSPPLRRPELDIFETSRESQVGMRDLWKKPLNFKLLNRTEARVVQPIRLQREMTFSLQTNPMLNFNGFIYNDQNYPETPTPFFKGAPLFSVSSLRD